MSERLTEPAVIAAHRRLDDARAIVVSAAGHGKAEMADVRGEGRHRIRGAGMTLKIGAEQSGRWSAFEAEVAPGFDVGAHRHAGAEEIFYLLEGELDLLAFEPRTTAPGDWTAWESAGGARVVRGGPGSLMFVPAGCPHAFTNPGTVPARMLFLVTPAGHEQYLEGIAELLSRPGPPDQAAIIELRARYDIEQLTSGMYGAIVVLEKGQKYDPSTDHAFVLGWDGDSVATIRDFRHARYVAEDAEMVELSC